VESIWRTGVDCFVPKGLNDRSHHFGGARLPKELGS
jgi:hypothetical protein